MVSSTSISSIHSDILHTHILTRLDGQSLASLSFTSSELRSLSNDETLWTAICHSTWSSFSDAHFYTLSQLISNFPNGARSFFSDSFPLLLTQPVISQSPNNPQSLCPIEIISAVDIHYKDKLLFSKVQETATHSRYFQCSPFRIDLIDSEKGIPTPLKLKDGISMSLMDDLRLSWIIVIGQKAANFSSFKPVSVQHYRLTNDSRVKFATILSIDQEVEVKCEITVTFEGDMEVSEVSMHVENMDGFGLNGKDSLEVLGRAIMNGERRMGSSDEAKERVEKYEQRTMKRSGKMVVNILANGWASDAIRLAAFGASVLLPFGMLVLCRTCFC
ncbi:hypothetical protein ACHQM5_019346 [Ranunculus cassubicifolius]